MKEEAQIAERRAQEIEEKARIAEIRVQEVEEKAQIIQTQLLYIRTRKWKQRWIDEYRQLLIGISWQLKTIYRFFYRSNK